MARDGGWLVKTEPGDYSFADLERDRRTTWDGVANPVALRNLGAMRAGDPVLVYHTGSEKAVVGLARAGADARPGKAGQPVVELVAVERLVRPVTLATVKADPRFAAFALVRQPRLSVMPVPAPLWQALLELGRHGGYQGG